MGKGVTSETVKNIITDAGAVYIDYGETNERLLGATSGGNTFTIEREVREIEVDNTKGKVKGLRRIIRNDAMLEVNLKEMSAENIKLALGSGSVTEDVDHSTITASNTIADLDYIDNITLVAPVTGSDKMVEITLFNALSDGDSLEMNLENENEAIITLSLSAHYDPNELDTVPYEIKYPIIT